ncbi:MAG: sugar transferase [Anaerolineales bacterium]|jgi:lipopolysaccharide/colanic/teichoic acid biosynthesis glycosyltransferase|nr:sugar transferase [Anaerolineales bacterium]
MKSTTFPSDDKYAWVNSFDPKKRVFVGHSYLIVKRIMDVTLVMLSAPFWIPALGFIALVIALTSPGAPAMFTQLRTGIGGKRFLMYKFRSMVPNAEELKAKYAYLNELQWPDFKITDDPRVTRVGKILRKTSLDELPQLINVLRGEMSLVGPRPTSFGSETYKLWHTERLDVMPGMTGLWQIIGRAQLEFDDRLRLDIAYIDRASIWLDINILLRTVAAVFKQRGAH